MKDLLLIDLQNRLQRLRERNYSHLSREFTVYTVDTRRKAMEVLKTAVMDAVIVDFDSGDERATEVIALAAEIAREHPRIELLSLSGSGIGAAEERCHHHGFIHQLREKMLAAASTAGDGRSEKKEHLSSAGGIRTAHQEHFYLRRRACA